MNETDNFWNVTTFNFYTDLFKSCKAWMNVYLNNDTHSPQDYVDLLLATGMDGPSLTAMIHGKTSKFKVFFQNNVFEPVFNWYYNTTCEGADCVRHCT